MPRLPSPFLRGGVGVGPFSRFAASQPEPRDPMRPHEMSAVALLDAFRRRQLSPVEAMRDVLDRVARFEPHIHATYLFAPERALADARASEARWAKGEPMGPLDGVPTTIKDNVATKGEPSPIGTAASDLTPAAADAPPAARLREAGAILFAKTTMPDYGMLSSGLSSFHPLTRNPWDLSRNPGGSSAGAGAAGAAGYGPLHLGTDIGGSVRLPAGWCGLVGLKPSAGRVPIDPPYLGRVAGPMTRNVADAALMMATLSAGGRAGLHEPAAANLGMADAACEFARPSHRPAAGGRLRRSRGARSGRGDRARRARFRGGRFACRAAGAVPHARHARRARSVLANALLDRHPRAAGGAACESAAFHPRLGRIGDRALGRSRFSRFQSNSRDAKICDRGDAAVRLCDLADARRSPHFPPNSPRRATIR